MTLASPKGSLAIGTYPKTLLSIGVLVGGLAIFLILASLLLVSQPIGSTDDGYFYGVDDSKKLDRVSSGLTHDEKVINSIVSSNVSSYTNKGDLAPLAYVPRNISSVDSGCDLCHGKWVYDQNGALYTNNSCPVLSQTQSQNCQGNGRPDKEYENWRWKPAQCDLPRFDAKKFLELMRGKTLAFIGDSLCRNQMESLLCILWQLEVPTSRGRRGIYRYIFKSTSTMIIRIWSSWLVHKTSKPFDYAPEDVIKVHLDAPDEDFMELIPNFDVIVLSSGHWFTKKSAYVLNKEIVGGQLW